MQYKTRGIVLHALDYNDRYSIVKIFTEEFGFASYLVSKTKGNKGKMPRTLFHPLSILDLEVEHHNRREIHQLKEAKVHLPLFSILCDPVKGSICIFLAEFLGKTIKDIQTDKLLFEYIVRSLEILELSDRDYANFHIVFAMRMSQFLGFYPDATDYESRCFFDMQNGHFTRYKPSHHYTLNPDESQVFALLLRMNYENMKHFRFSRKQRKEILEYILQYYRLHTTNFTEIKSLEVLQELFS